MESILQADVFFFVTSIFVVVLTVVLAIAGFYLIRAMKSFSDIATILKNGVTQAESELAEMSFEIQESPLFGFLFGRKKRKRADKNHNK